MVQALHLAVSEANRRGLQPDEAVTETVEGYPELLPKFSEALAKLDSNAETADKGTKKKAREGAMKDAHGLAIERAPGCTELPEPWSFLDCKELDDGGPLVRGNEASADRLSSYFQSRRKEVERLIGVLKLKIDEERVQAVNKKPKRKASGGGYSMRSSSKYDMSNVTVMLESEMLLPDVRKYMKKDEERGERQIELLTEIGHGMKGLAEAQKEIATG
eukprot:jgi/Tetstr1/446696/TSEL_003635.t1